MKQFIKKNFWLILSVFYVILPFDIIPEFLLPILGPLIIIDDVGVLLLALAQRYWKFRKDSNRDDKKNLKDEKDLTN